MIRSFWGSDSLPITGVTPDPGGDLGRQKLPELKVPYRPGGDMATRSGIVSSYEHHKISSAYFLGRYYHTLYIQVANLWGMTGPQGTYLKHQTSGMTGCLGWAYYQITPISGIFPRGKIYPAMLVTRPNALDIHIAQVTTGNHFPQDSW